MKILVQNLTWIITLYIDEIVSIFSESDGIYQMVWTGKLGFEKE
jgi:hypothetical protein